MPQTRSTHNCWIQTTCSGRQRSPGSRRSTLSNFRCCVYYVGHGLGRERTGHDMPFSSEDRSLRQMLTSKKWCTQTDILCTYISLLRKSVKSQHMLLFPSLPWFLFFPLFPSVPHLSCCLFLLPLSLSNSSLCVCVGATEAAQSRGLPRPGHHSLPRSSSLRVCSL